MCEVANPAVHGERRALQSPGLRAAPGGSGHCRGGHLHSAPLLASVPGWDWVERFTLSCSP